MNKNDLRYIKTEEKLKSAYLELLSKNSNRQITVKEICKLASCSRNTFYLHYETREDLEKQFIREILDTMAFAFFPKETDISKFDHFDNRQYTDGIIDSVSQKQKALTIFLKNDSGTFTKALADTIFNQCLESTNSYILKEITEDIVLSFRYLAQAITGFIYEWLTNSSYTADEAKDLLYFIHDPTIRSISKLLA